MIRYFGHEENPERWYVDTEEDGKLYRQFVSQEIWTMVVKAASLPSTGNVRHAVDISSERITVEKFDCDAHEITPETVPAEVIHF